MSVRICDWIRVEIGKDTRDAINKYFFKAESIPEFERTGGRGLPSLEQLIADPLDNPNFIPCGSPILDNYAPTSTLQGCNRIARDGIITPGKMFVHMWSRSQPQHRSFIRAPLLEKMPKRQEIASQERLARTIEVRLPFVEWALGNYGLRVVGPPKTTCSDFDCTWNRAKNSWTMKKGNTSYRATVVSDCSSKNYPVHLRSVEYYAGSLAGDNETFRKYSRNGESISAQGILNFIFSELRDAIYNALEPANEE